MGAEVSVTLGDIVRLQKRLASFTTTFTRAKGLAPALAALMETQTKDRIESEKKSPEGEAWAPWSARYAATRQPHHSLLISQQKLLDSIVGVAVNGVTVSVGSGMIYAPTHQFGDPSRRIPKRPFLGISQQNADELMEVIEDWVKENL